MDGSHASKTGAEPLAQLETHHEGHAKDLEHVMSEMQEYLSFGEMLTIEVPKALLPQFQALMNRASARKIADEHGSTRTSATKRARHGEK